MVGHGRVSGDGSGVGSVPELLLSGAMLKLPWVSRLITGNPITIIRDGQLDQKALKKLRMTVDDLMETLRQQGTFDIADVQYAIVEANGKISVYPKTGARQVTCDDLNLNLPDNGMSMVIVSDGKVSQWGLSVCGLDESWLRDVLAANTCKEQDVFIMTADKSRQYTLIRKEQCA